MNIDIMKYEHLVKKFNNINKVSEVIRDIEKCDYIVFFETDKKKISFLLNSLKKKYESFYFLASYIENLFCSYKMDKNMNLSELIEHTRILRIDLICFGMYEIVKYFEPKKGKEYIFDRVLNGRIEEFNIETELCFVGKA